MGQLRSIDIGLEALTPMWIGGAWYQPELRAPSFRGIMRFWLRALLGGVMEDLSEVRAGEAAVFGLAGRASVVAVRATGAVRTGPPPVSAEQFPGVGYMHWSMYQRKRAAILPGEPFRLRVQTRPLEPAPVEVCGRELAVADCLELAAASVWLMVRLGGIGARARRCAGTMAGTVEPEGWPDGLPPLTSGARTTAELAVELSDGIRQLRRRTGWQAGPPTTPSEFDILHPNVCEIHLADRTFPNWWEAVDWIGQAFLAFRKAQVDDASGVAGLLARGRLTVRTVQRAVLGLPIVFFFKSMFQSMTDSGMDPREARRRASAGVSPRRGMARGSPLMFRVVRLAGPSPAYAVMMTLFRSQFLPDGAISIRPQQRGMRSVEAPAPADYRLVDAWFDFVRGEHAPLLPVSVSQ